MTIPTNLPAPRPPRKTGKPASEPSHQQSSLADEQPAPRPASHPAPTRIDAAAIDTPLKAALVPIMDPALQWVLAMGFSYIVCGGDDAPWGMRVSYTANTQQGHSHATYEMDAISKPEIPIRAQGTVQGQALHEGCTLDSEGLHLRGHIGKNLENLEMAPGHVEGHLGQVSAALDFAMTDDGYQVRGKLGDEPYQAKATLHPGLLVIEGKLGDMPIRREYKMERDGETLVYHGNGTIGEVQQTVELSATLLR